MVDYDFGDDISFDSLISRYEAFIRPLEPQLTPVQWQLAWEVRSRLKEVRYLLNRIRVLHRAVNVDPIGGASDVHGLSSMEELWLHCEALYHFAFRAYKILEKMPFARQFKAPGVRDVRNHLIEHPTGESSGVVDRTFLVDWQGPKVKGVRVQGTVGHLMDSGLYANVREFITAIEKVLAR